MHLLKFFLLISLTIFIVANENNQTNSSNESNRTTTLTRATTQNIIVITRSQSNEFIDFSITLGNANHIETLKTEGTFKVIDMFGNIRSETYATFLVPPKKARTYRSNSLKVNVLKDTKVYIQANLGGVISRSNDFIIYK